MNDKASKITGRPYGVYSHTPMPHGCLYLNNSGSRWVCNDMRFILVTPDGKRTLRLAICYEAFGNFAAVVYRYKGKQYRGLPKSKDGMETRLDTDTGLDALPHVFHSNG